ncbi:hypothetical protein Lfu02_00070 [Longispora fulva]|nr:hypothetical protein Lfu02_00070 [Longispora fulva]
MHPGQKGAGLRLSWSLRRLSGARGHLCPPVRRAVPVRDYLKIAAIRCLAPPSPGGVESPLRGNVELDAIEAELTRRGGQNRPTTGVQPVPDRRAVATSNIQGPK